MPGLRPHVDTANADQPPTAFSTRLSRRQETNAAILALSKSAHQAARTLDNRSRRMVRQATRCVSCPSTAPSSKNNWLYASNRRTVGRSSHSVEVASPGRKWDLYSTKSAEHSSHRPSSHWTSANPRTQSRRRQTEISGASKLAPLAPRLSQDVVAGHRSMQSNRPVRNEAAKRHRVSLGQVDTSPRSSISYATQNPIAQHNRRRAS
jgi:hypothetical protein